MGEVVSFFTPSRAPDVPSFGGSRQDLFSLLSASFGGTEVGGKHLLRTLHGGVGVPWEASFSCLLLPCEARKAREGTVVIQNRFFPCFAGRDIRVSKVTLCMEKYNALLALLLVHPSEEGRHGSRQKFIIDFVFKRLPNNIYKRKETTKQHQQNANTKQLLQNQNDVFL